MATKKYCAKCQKSFVSTYCPGCGTASSEAPGRQKADYVIWYENIWKNHEYRDLNASEINKALDMVFQKLSQQTAKQELWRVNIGTFGDKLKYAWNQGLIPGYFDECCEKIKNSPEFKKSILDGANGMLKDNPGLVNHPTFKAFYSKLQQAPQTVSAEEF